MAAAPDGCSITVSMASSWIGADLAATLRYKQNVLVNKSLGLLVGICVHSTVDGYCMQSDQKMKRSENALI